MSASYPVAGRSRWIASTPANTNEATLHTFKKGNQLIGLHVTNLTASPANATVKIGDGSSDFSVMHVYEIPARGFHIMDEKFFYPMGDSYTVKITSGTASALTFLIVILEGQSALTHSMHQENV